MNNFTHRISWTSSREMYLKSATSESSQIKTPFSSFWQPSTTDSTNNLINDDMAIAKNQIVVMKKN